MPRFSVVIAAYNAASWIVHTVRSALAQTYPASEVIVIGDGCTDATGDLVIANFGDRVRWANLEANSGGQSLPNNEGIQCSTGTHIAYLGHDDIWSPHHLERLSAVIRAFDPDFAVSGAVFHAPPGSRYYQITGMFDDPRTAEKEFFPPSSLAHRRDVTDRVGPWREPSQLRAPADCEFLLRAARQGCSFASTKSLTVHKFAAGHRYLSYRFPSGTEQARMLDRLLAPGGEAKVLEEIRNDIAQGADNPPIRYFDFDRHPAGDLFRRNRRTKGLEKALPTLVDKPMRLPVDGFAAGLDWYPLEAHPRLGPYRWSGPNPNPRYLVNVRLSGAYLLKIHILAFTHDALAPLLALDVDEREVSFVRERTPEDTHILAVGPLSGPVDDGVVLRFRLPHGVRLPNDAQRRLAGLALRAVEVVPLA